MADSFADGELSGREHVRFERHLAACVACAAAVEAARETKRLLAALPEYDAPRSFRLTPAMARQTRPGRAEARPAWAPTLVLRASQATAGLAAAALAVVLIGNMSLSGGDADDSVAPADALQADEKAGGAVAPAATSAATSAAAQPGSTNLDGATPAATLTVPPAPRTGGNGQEAPISEDTLAGGTEDADQQFRNQAEPPGASSYSNSSAPADTPSGVVPTTQLFGLDDRTSENSADGDAFPKMEAGLAVILFAAIATAVAAGRKRKGTS